MNAIRLRILALSFVLVASSFIAGCGDELFNRSGSNSESRLDKYYDGDSAVQTTESRKKASDMGFGYPTGPANQ